MRDLQKMIRIATKSWRYCSLNKLAQKAGVDRKLIMRILESRGYPRLDKAMAIIKACGHQLEIVEMKAVDDG